MKLSQNLSRLGTEAAFKVLADEKKKIIVSPNFFDSQKILPCCQVTIIFRHIVLLSRYSQNLSKAADSR